MAHDLTRRRTGHDDGEQQGDRGDGLKAGVDELRKSDVMSHLIDAFDAGQDVGHYGRLVFAMVARHFLSEHELVEYLRKNPGIGEEDARALYLQVQGRDYNPPKRQRILEWQREQDFPICPNPDDPQACNVYRDLRFPDDVYEKIEEFYEEKAESHGPTGGDEGREGRRAA